MNTPSKSNQLRSQIASISPGDKISLENLNAPFGVVERTSQEIAAAMRAAAEHLGNITVTVAGDLEQALPIVNDIRRVANEERALTNSPMLAILEEPTADMVKQYDDPQGRRYVRTIRTDGEQDLSEFWRTVDELSSE